MPFSPLEFWFLIASPFAGSFLGLLIVRLSKGEGVVLGRSKCPACQTPLKPLDLIPFVSFLALKGKCRYCGAKISPFYPLIEALAVLTTLWAAWVTEGAVFLVSAILGWWLLALAATDSRELILPDVLTLPLIPAGFVSFYYFNPGEIQNSLIGAAIGFLGFYLISLLYKKFRGREGLGLGDAKLMAGLGALNGWMGLPGVLLWAVGSGFIYVLMELFRGKIVSPRTPLPFGAFLCLGGWLSWLYGAVVFGF